MEARYRGDDAGRDGAVVQLGGSISNGGGEHYLPDLFNCGREKEKGRLWNQMEEL